MKDDENGEHRIEWASMFMPVLNKVKEKFENSDNLNNVRVGMSLHIEPKTAMLVRTLEAGGAKIFITGCNPLTTQDDTVEALRKSGTKVFGHRGQSDEEYCECLNKVLDSKPHIIIDDGGDLVTLLHEERENEIENISGACEETTTGIQRLRAMENNGELSLPVIDVNGANSKHLFDNFYGTGESVLASLMTTTNTMISGKNFTIIGYGFCGRGVAMKARGLGALVTICEVDELKALQARMDGFNVMKINDAIRNSDFVLCVTGMKGVVKREDFEVSKDKCIFANAGHFNVEIDLECLKEMSKVVEKITPDITKYVLNDRRKLFVISDGRLVNLASTFGMGHPIEVMDMSFGIQALSAEYVFMNGMVDGVHKVPKMIDDFVIKVKGNSLNVGVDSLSKAQKEYYECWRNEK